MALCSWLLKAYKLPSAVQSIAKNTKLNLFHLYLQAKIQNIYKAIFVSLKSVESFEFPIPTASLESLQGKTRKSIKSKKTCPHDCGWGTPT